ncbi:MAG: hypothetical protein NTV51_10470 [Verrucomicrobia bacterium]|nr:hypothetical protein [Verrucomicrobiota bacterium]
MPTPFPSPRFLWWSLVAVFGAVLTCFAATPDSFRAFGINHLGPWFLDLQAILASCDAQAAGLDPYANNPLDLFGRPHSYSDWWLTLGRMGCTRADTVPLGFLLCGAFVVTALASLRPRQPGELLWSLAVLCSPPFLLALDRANNDLVMFLVLAPVVPCLVSTRLWVRLLAVPLIVFAGALKAYPLVAGIVLLGGDGPRDTRRLVFAGALLLAAALPGILSDLRHYAANVPDAAGLTTMGAANLWVGLGVAPLPARWLARLLALAIVGGFLCAKPFAGWSVAPADRGAWLGFVLGAALLTGCFFAGTSYSYRWIFVLWMAPWLWQTPRDPAVPRRVRRFAVLTATLLLFAMWADSGWSALINRFLADAPPGRVMAVADRVFYLEQPLLWALFVCLLGFLAHFAQEGLWRLFSAERPAIPPAR